VTPDIRVVDSTFFIDGLLHGIFAVLLVVALFADIGDGGDVLIVGFDYFGQNGLPLPDDCFVDDGCRSDEFDSFVEIEFILEGLENVGEEDVLDDS
jgi:hypothetical protein